MQIIENEYLKQKIKASLGDVYDLLKKEKAFLAGGAITSLFCRREINDWDIYLRSKYSGARIVLDATQEHEHLSSFQLFFTAKTKKSLMASFNDSVVQFITFKYFSSPEQIFGTFDFTINMGCFCFETEKFYLHDNFMLHNSQRTLRYNTGTAYPLISALRVQKYLEKGYYISKLEMMRILTTVTQIKITTWEEAEDHLGGMYSQTLSELHGEAKNEEFSIALLLECLGKENYHPDVLISKEAMVLMEEEILEFFEIIQRSNYFYKSVNKEDKSDNCKHIRNAVPIHYKKGEIVNGGSCGIYCVRYSGNTYRNARLVTLEALPGTIYDGEALIGDVLVVNVEDKKEVENRSIISELEEMEENDILLDGGRQ